MGDSGHPTAAPLCCSCLLTLLPYFSMEPLHGLQSSRINLLQCRVSMGHCSFRAYPPAPAWGRPQLQRGYLLYRGLSRGCRAIPAPPWSLQGLQGIPARAPGAPPPLLLLSPVLAGLFLTLFPSLFTARQRFVFASGSSFSKSQALFLKFLSSCT